MNKSILKSKFGWDVSALPEYIKDDSVEILRKEVLKGQTLDLITIQEGVKHKEVVKQFDIDVEWASGDACGFDASGDAKFTEREIEVANIKLEKKFCNLDLLDKWTQEALRAGSIAELEDFPYEDIVIGYLNQKNADVLDKAVWQSDSSLTSGNFQFFDGFEELFDDESANMVDLNTTGYTTFTSANAYDVLFSAYKDFMNDDTGAALLDTGDVIAMVNRSQFLALIKNITDENKFHFSTQEATANGEFILPGTDLVVKMFTGRPTNSTVFYFGRPQDMVFGTDLRGDTDQVKIWYNEDEEEIRIRVRFKAGTQITFPEHFGIFELAAS